MARRILLILLVCITTALIVTTVYAENMTNWASSAHGQADLPCESCHPEGTQGKVQNLRSELCQDCHQKEYAQWSLSAHNVPLPYTYEEIGDARIRECAKCHNADGFSEVLASGEDFHEAWASMPEEDPAGITCISCHDPHGSANQNQLRLAKAELCTSCHGVKWQTLMLTGTSQDEYAGEDYTATRPSSHNSGDRCVMCHMTDNPDISLGGHTLLMTSRTGKKNVAACESCHEGTIGDFNVKGMQTEVDLRLTRLESYLKEQNGGELPGFEPGNCNRCHRGGTLPFNNDPEGNLDRAYQVYRFVKNDKSLGVHNGDYAIQLLDDAYRNVGGTEPLSRPEAQMEDDSVCLSCKW